MKFLRYRKNSTTKPACMKNDIIYDLSSVIEEISNKTIEKLLNTNIDITKLDKVESYDKLEMPIVGVEKVVCIGLNYADHAAESGLEIPSEPVVFMKTSSSLCGPYDNVELPKNSSKTDWEVELGIVIGKKAKYIEEADAYDYIAGFTIVNDVSEREFQLEREGQWAKGKCHDTFCPIGPYIVTKDEVGDEGNLKMTLTVDDKLFQNGSTATMYYKVPYIISYLSRFMTLNPGDIISTGTPPGVGLGQKPPVYLKDNQVMELNIEKLGTQRQTTVAL